MENYTIVLEWTFSPSDYFEELISIKCDTYEMSIDNGKVEARIDSIHYDDKTMRNVLHQELNNRFSGAQLLEHRAYEISAPSMRLLYFDGRTVPITIISCKIGSMTTTGLRADIITMDSQGNIITSSRNDRITRKRRLSEWAALYGANDKVAALLLKSFNSAINNPQNEPGYLYDIWEALEIAFGNGNEGKAKEMLKNFGVGNANACRKHITILANYAPIKQSRHRGTIAIKNSGELRDPTPKELEQARNAAMTMIEAYFKYLDDKGESRLV